MSFSTIISGVLFVGLFALASLYLTEFTFLSHMGVSPLIIAIVLGMIVGNTLRHRFPKEWVPGIQFSAKKILRIAIIFYGFRISFQEIVSIGMQGLLLDVGVVLGTLIVGTWIGITIFKIDRHLAILISMGAAICGAAAVLAAEEVIKSEPYKAAIAIATVVIFGTLSMFLYPILQQSGFFHLTDQQYGLFVGASIHEVAQVVVAGNSVDAETGNIAVIVKMTRVLLLVPVLILLSIYENRRVAGKASPHKKLIIPWFAVFFAICIGFHSLQITPLFWVNVINQFDIFLLTMAMAAIGLETHLKQFKTQGLKPFYLSMFLFGWLGVFSYALV